jgi:Arc/MetJ-type ribon-helix-helix transcriptional regulator
MHSECVSRLLEGGLPKGSRRKTLVGRPPPLVFSSPFQGEAAFTRMLLQGSETSSASGNRSLRNLKRHKAWVHCSHRDGNEVLKWHRNSRNSRERTSPTTGSGDGLDFCAQSAGRIGDFCDRDKTYTLQCNWSDKCVIMSDMSSKRISVRIPEALTAKLRSRSRAQGTSESDLVRESLETYFAESTVERTAYELAEEAGIIGSVSSAPKDLSTNPRYLKGFGKGK